MSFVWGVFRPKIVQGGIYNLITDGDRYEYENIWTEIVLFINRLLKRGAHPRDIEITLSEFLTPERDKQSSQVSFFVNYGPFLEMYGNYRVRVKHFPADNILAYPKAKELSNQFVIDLLENSGTEITKIKVFNQTVLSYEFTNDQKVRFFSTVMYYARI